MSHLMFKFKSLTAFDHDSFYDKIDLQIMRD